MADRMVYTQQNWKKSAKTIPLISVFLSSAYKTIKSIKCYRLTRPHTYQVSTSVDSPANGEGPTYQPTNINRLT